MMKTVLNYIKVTISFFLLIYFASIHAATSLPFLFLNQADLTYVSQQIQQNNPRYLPAYKNLISNANKALKNYNISVMDKKLTAPSNDKHDYFSISPYWWPNPNSKDGLPYIRRDGMSNPMANNDDTDKLTLNKFARDVYTLALAYYFTGSIEYANKAKQMIITWFIAPDTKMNPNMNYAQTLYEKDQVRGYGMIDGRVFIEVIEAIALIKPANVLSEQDYQALKNWFGDFYHWMLMSDNGQIDQKRTNNHGSYFELQATAYALFLGQSDQAKTHIDNVKNKLITQQFNLDGQQLEELERTRSWHYSNFNLNAYNQLGRLGAQMDIDLWHADDSRLKAGYLFISDYIDTAKIWSYPDSDSRDQQGALANMLMASKVYGDPIFKQKAQYLINKYPKNIIILLLPITN